METKVAETTGELARFVVETRYEDLPPEVVAQSRNCFLDWLGVALAGSREPLADILVSVVREMGGEPRATVLAKGLKTTPLHAALVNGAMSHALDYDDTHMPSGVHPSAPVWPAALALCEAKGLGGRDLVTAFVLGLEVETRVGLAVGRAFFERGWHPTAAAGHFGAAAAAGKLLGLSAPQMARALGLAGTQAAGLAQVHGTMAKPLHPGKAALDGLLAALLAQRGFTCPENIIEGHEGFLAAFAGGGDPERATRGLGQSYQIMRVSFKPYAACHITHAGIDALRELRSRHALQPRQVAQIRCQVPPLLLRIAAKPEPRTGLEGKFSMQHCLAVAMAQGQAQEGQFTDAQVQDPLLVDLRHKVELIADPALKPTQAAVTVVTVEGQEYYWKTEAGKGNPQNPMTEEEFEAKFRGLAALALPKDKIERLLGLVRQLDQLEDLSALMQLCA